MKILHLDSNYPLLAQLLQEAGHENYFDYTSTQQEIENKITDYEGIVIRSRFKIDKNFIDKASHLKCIARVGAGLESIDVEYAQSKGIALIAAPEGNRNAVGEHALGMLLSLLNNLNQASNQVKQGQWNREANRGYEMEGKTIGIIGYGNMGQSFAKKLQGFDCKVIFHDLLPNLSNSYATQVSLFELQQQADVLSLHTPLTDTTLAMVNETFINTFAKPFWFINTARGKTVVTSHLVKALQSGKIKGAALDVLEYESVSFENIFGQSNPDLDYLIQAPNVLLTPHIAGWTFESHEKLAKVIAQKIIQLNQ